MDAKLIMSDLVTNYTTLKAGMKWTDKRLLYLMAKAFIEQPERLDNYQIKQVSERLKEQTGFFTALTPAIREMITVLLVAHGKGSASDISILVSDYEALKEAGFKASANTYFSAYLLQPSKQALKATQITKGLAIYQEMKANHPFITGYEAYSQALSLAISPLVDEASPKEIANLVEMYYQGLHQIGYHERNSIQFAACSCVSLLGKAEPAFIDEVANISNQLVEKGFKLKPLHYSSIVMLTFIKGQVPRLDLEELMDYVKEANSQIKLLLDKDFRSVLALNLYIESWSTELSNDVSNSLAISLNQIIIQEQAIVASIAVTASNN